MSLYDENLILHYVIEAVLFTCIIILCIAINKMRARSQALFDRICDMYESGATYLRFAKEHEDLHKDIPKILGDTDIKCTPEEYEKFSSLSFTVQIRKYLIPMLTYTWNYNRDTQTLSIKAHNISNEKITTTFKDLGIEL